MVATDRRNWKWFIIRTRTNSLRYGLPGMTLVIVSSDVTVYVSHPWIYFNGTVLKEGMIFSAPFSSFNRGQY